jgi:hypothetical protein
VTYFSFALHRRAGNNPGREQWPHQGGPTGRPDEVVPTAIAGKLPDQGTHECFDPAATLLQAFQGSILLRRPRLDDDTCALNRRDLNCAIFQRGIPVLFSLGRIHCPDRIEGLTA